MAPEQELDPKRRLVEIAGKSTSKSVRTDFTPIAGGKRKAGPGYEASLIEFGSKHWRWREAQRRCPSLESCVAALRRLKKELRQPLT